MSDLPTYTVALSLEHGWWIVRVVDASPGADTAPVDRVSQCRRLSHVDEIARDLVATILDTAPDSFDVRIIDEPL